MEQVPSASEHAAIERWNRRALLASKPAVHVPLTDDQLELMASQSGLYGVRKAAAAYAREVLAASTAPAQSTDDARAAVDFYAANPSAALVDFQKRFAPAQSCGDAEQAAYSAPFTTDVPHCCGDPDTCNDPCEQISWTSAQLDALLEDADRLGKYKGFVSRTLFDCARVIREFRAAITGEKQAEQEADGPCCKGMAPSDDCWQECGGTKKRPSRAASTQAGLLDEQIIDEWVKRRFSDIPERHNPCKETIASEQADVPLRAAVESMVCMLENGEWAEHASTYKAPGDKLAARLEAAITDLHNELSGDSEQADEAATDAFARLVAFHAEQLDSNPYCYFELAYTRSTAWMAWITDRPAQGEPGTAAYAKSRKVIVRGQGDTPTEACQDALNALNAARAKDSK
jgi:hypothetical protein